MLKEDAPKEFTAYMHITVVPKKAPISSIKEFFASEYSRTSYGYFLDTNIVKIVVDLEEENSDAKIIEKSNALLEEGKLKEAIMTLYNCGSESDTIMKAIDKFYERVSFDIAPTTTLCEEGYNFVDDEVYADYYYDRNTALLGMQLIDAITKKKEIVATITVSTSYSDVNDVHTKISCQKNDKVVVDIFYDVGANALFMYDIKTNTMDLIERCCHVKCYSQDYLVLKEMEFVTPDVLKFYVYNWNGQLIFEDSTISWISLDGDSLYYVDVTESHFSGVDGSLYAINKAKINGASKQVVCVISSSYDPYFVISLDSHFLYYFSSVDGKQESIDLRNPQNITISSDSSFIPKSGTIENVAVGDYITFGSYEQDNNTSNGKEDIEWLVLDVKDGKAMVISKYALDCQPYNTSYTDVTWETCTLRTWLNGSFYNTAFSTAEKSKIPTVTVVNNDNPRHGTDGGNNTTDKVFLLSIDEANTYFLSGNARECEATAYAVAQGAWIATSSSYYGNCCWGLRSPGKYQYGAAYVVDVGDVSKRGYAVYDGSVAVRPALWINL